MLPTLPYIHKYILFASWVWVYININNQLIYNSFYNKSWLKTEARWYRNTPLYFKWKSIFNINTLAKLFYFAFYINWLRAYIRELLDRYIYIYIECRKICGMASSLIYRYNKSIDYVHDYICLSLLETYAGVSAWIISTQRRHT